RHLAVVPTTGQDRASVLGIGPPDDNGVAVDAERLPDVAAKFRQYRRLLAVPDRCLRRLRSIGEETCPLPRLVDCPSRTRPVVSTREIAQLALSIGHRPIAAAVRVERCPDRDTLLVDRKEKAAGVPFDHTDALD